MTLIKKFEDITSEELNFAGGKATNLVKMKKAGILVPNGFVILSGLFDDFLKQNNLHSLINCNLARIDINDFESLQNASLKITNAILNGRISKDVKDNIFKVHKELKFKNVIVRSSATCEDSAETTWAGQLDSFINVGKNDLLYSIKKCWASLFGHKALFYRLQKGFLNENISIAVVVQKMINSEKSGIAFSVNPNNYKSNEILIEACLGLGQPIVSGQITPDNYIVDKKTYKILGVNIKNQSYVLYNSYSYSTAWKKLSDIGKKQKLTLEELFNLSKIVVRIEDYYGYPCDIEWAKENQKFYIVQSRPITTIDTEKKQKFYKVMTRPLNLIDCQIWDFSERLNLPKKFNNLLFFSPLFVYIPGKAVQVYYNFTDSQQDPDNLLDFLKKNVSWVAKQKSIFDENCKNIRKLISNNTYSYKKLISLIQDVWPIITVANIFGNYEESTISRELKKIFIQIRKESDDILHPGLSYLNKILSLKFNIKNIENLLIEEILNDKIPSKSELDKRKNGWYYYMGNLICDDFNGKHKNIQIVGSKSYLKSSNTIKGNIAYQGYVKNYSRKIFELSKLNDIKNGEVLVTPMTTPKMVPILNKVSGIITDEGGITCHAAIIAREMKIPCIVGTKNATKVIKDGDLVELDAYKGTIKILKNK